MSRRAAFAILSGFAFLFCLASWFGVRDILRFRDELARCAATAVLDYSSFWMAGFWGVALLLLLAVSPNPRWHATVFAVIAAVMLLVPLALHGWTVASADEAGYEAAEPGQWHLGPVAFQAARCG